MNVDLGVEDHLRAIQSAAQITVTDVVVVVVVVVVVLSSESNDPTAL